MDRTALLHGLSRFEFVATIATFASGIAFVGIGFVVWFTDLGEFDDERAIVGLFSIGGGWLLGVLAMKWDDLSALRTLLLAAFALWWVLTALAAGDWWSGNDAGLSAAQLAVPPTVLFPVLLVISRLRRGRTGLPDE